MELYDTNAALDNILLKLDNTTLTPDDRPLALFLALDDTTFILQLLTQVIFN